MSTPLDDIDSRLLGALLSDGRASATELADAAGIATSTATKRLSALEESGVIEGYQPEVDYAAFGYEVTAVFRLDVEGSGLATVVEDLAATAQMVDVYEVTGGDDIVAIGKFTDTGELNARIRDLVTHEEVRTVATNIVLDTVCEYDAPPVKPSDEGS